MRDFLNEILEFIGASSLTDDEFDSIELEEEELSLASYTALLGILDARELVSETRDRLRFYFLAADVSVPDSTPEASNIYLGDALCD